MKRLTTFLTIICTLSLLAACHPTSPKPQPPTPDVAHPAAEPLTSATASLTLTASATTSTPAPALPTPTASLTVAAPIEVPPAPLLGPTSSSATVAPATETTSTPVVTSSTPVVPVPPTPPGKVVIRVLAPEGQLTDGVKQELTSKLGTEVVIDTYTSFDDALRKLNAPAPAYNLALISYRLVPVLIADQKLAALPTLPIALQPAPKYLHHFFDRDNKYSLPYTFSLAGLAVRKADVKTPVTQWSHLFTETNFKLAHLPDDEAFKSTLLIKAGLRNGSGPSGIPRQAEGEVNPIQVNSIATLKKKFATQPGWQFVLPGEGSVIFLNCVVIPANSPQPERAAAVLTQFFEPDLIARIAEENYLGVTQMAAYRTLPPASTADAAIYPRNDILDKCIFVRSGYRPIPAPAAAGQ